MEPTACNYNPAATQDDGSCDLETCYGCTDATACNYSPGATLSNGSCEFTTCEGCTAPSACNFDFTATIDDDSCEYLTCQGCTNLDACNYDPSATIDDDSCNFDCSTCPADLDNDGAIAVSDILLLLSDFGCDTPPCVGDVDGDDATNVSDCSFYSVHSENLAQNETFKNPPSACRLGTECFHSFRRLLHCFRACS